MRIEIAKEEVKEEIAKALGTYLTFKYDIFLKDMVITEDRDFYFLEKMVKEDTDELQH